MQFFLQHCFTLYLQHYFKMNVLSFSRVVGMLTISDFINILVSYYKSPLVSIS